MGRGGALGYYPQSPSLPHPPKFYVHTYYISPMCTREHGKVINPGVDMYIHNTTDVNIYSTEDLATHAKFTKCHDYMFNQPSHSQSHHLTIIKVIRYQSAMHSFPHRTTQKLCILEITMYSYS